MCKLKITQGEYMSNRNYFEDEDLIEICEQCEDCFHPNGCIRACAIKSHVVEDVAAVRGEQQ
jgi:hypothetical protein